MQGDVRGESDMPIDEIIVSDLESSSIQDAVREIVGHLVARGAVDEHHEASIVEAILKREELGSTAIGRGFAVPHAKHSSVKETIVTLAASRQGIPWKSLNDESVHTVFLLLSPFDRPGDHLCLLERISRHARAW